LHIGIDARMVYYRVGGISTYIRKLVETLEKIDTGDHRFTVFHSRKGRETLTRRFRRADLWTPSHHRLERLALSVEIARFGLDVWHTTDFIPPQFGARRQIVSVHDLTFLRYPQFLTSESRRYYNHQIAWAVRHADRILTLSHASKADIIELLNVPPDKITVQHLAADSAFKPLSAADTAPIRQLLNLPSTFILFVGTFEPRKNIDGLLRAYSILRHNMRDAPPLVLAGSRGWLYDDILSLIDQLDLSQSVLLRENLSQDVMPALYNLARTLVLPSHYEGFGLPALEAMACGIPTIVSRRSSLPEVVGGVGLLIDPDDPHDIAAAIARMLNESDWYAEQCAAALQRAAQFTWERAAQIALSIYTL
jgi:glycosyltransferase involved in cell wall biosynthesis